MKICAGSNSGGPDYHPKVPSLTVWLDWFGGWALWARQLGAYLCLSRPLALPILEAVFQEGCPQGM